MTGVAAFLVLLGSVLVLFASIGLHRFPDVYDRLQVAGKAPALGVPLVMLGAALLVDGGPAKARLLVAGVLVAVTAPASSEALARASLRRRRPMAEDLLDARLTWLDDTPLP